VDRVHRTSGFAPAGVRAVADAVRQRYGERPPVALVPDLVEENAKAVGAELLGMR